MQLRRYLGHTTRLGSQYFAKTTLAPKSFKLSPPTQFHPQSLLVFSTPTNLQKVIEQTIKVHEEHKIPIVVAGIDSIINSNRDGVSELWLDEPIKINNSKVLKDEPGQSAKVNWKNVESSFGIRFANDNTVKLNLANTIFHTNNMVTMYYLNGQDNSGQTLSELSVSVPLSTEVVSSTDKWIKLTDQLTITDYKGNLLKSINNTSAASFLETNEQLMAIASKETEVYCKIYPDGASTPLKYKIIAGGGGWGVKANIIALSPEAKISKGDLIEFYMLTPQDKLTKEDTPLEQLVGKFTLESTYEELNYHNDTAAEKALDNTFACGSEQGFSYNGVKYASNGETLVLKFD